MIEWMKGADERVPRLCIRVYNTTFFDFDTADWLSTFASWIRFLLRKSCWPVDCISRFQRPHRSTADSRCLELPDPLCRLWFQLR